MRLQIIFKFLIFLHTEMFIMAQSYRNEFKNDCSKQSLTRIVGGTNTKAGEFPWIARIGFKINNIYRVTFFCDGSLITDYHVLTAKHCFYQFDKFNKIDLFVSLGNHNSKKISSCKKRRNHPVIYKVDKVMRYDWEENYHDDIAVVKLKRKVQFTSRISPICLPDVPYSSSDLIGQEVQVIGFGLVDSSRDILAKILQKITIKIKPLYECHIFMKMMWPGQLCAGHPKKDSCSGDSGAPLFKLMWSDNHLKFIQLGIVSLGSPICEDDRPAIYTDINYYLIWIDSVLEE